MTTLAISHETGPQGPPHCAQAHAILTMMQSSRAALLLLTDNLTSTRQALQQAGMLGKDDAFAGLIFRLTGAAHAAIKDLRGREGALLASMSSTLL